jgi:hypothetical protein
MSSLGAPMLLYLVKIFKVDLPRSKIPWSCLQLSSLSEADLWIHNLFKHRKDNYISLSKEHVIKPIAISSLQTGINLPDLDILVDYV